MSPTLEQSNQALQRANEVRLARADLKHRIARGELFAASVILRPPAEARTWPIGQLVMCQRRWGETRMRNLLARLEIPERKAAGALTERQRHKLARALGQTDQEAR